MLLLKKITIKVTPPQKMRDVINIDVLLHMLLATPGVVRQNFVEIVIKDFFSEPLEAGREREIYQKIYSTFTARE